MSNTRQQQATSTPTRHEAVILFYKYLDPSSSKACRYLHQHSTFYLAAIEQFQKELCTRLGCKGRILLAAEGINGTLSAESISVLQEYRAAMEAFDLLDYAGLPTNTTEEEEEEEEGNPYIYKGIDWKESYLQSPSSDGNDQQQQQQQQQPLLEPFPNLKISVVKELVSSGGVVSVQDIARYGGTHLNPEEFHQKIIGNHNNDNNKPVVLIDVRNTFEYGIGHFVNPNTQEAAMNPEMVTFSMFDPQFCATQAEALKDKTVLMYCTGGIRCEKASVMLKKRGVQDVYQLQGGIHRYLETYGEAGCFRGRNFQFDQRVSLTPAEHYQQRHYDDDGETNNNDNNGNNVLQTTTASTSSPIDPPQTVVGKCIECSTPFDEISGSRICTVCRDLVLVCPTCQERLREYHCQRHAGAWKAYFTFLEVFDQQQLQDQLIQLETLLDRDCHPDYSKHVRKTVRKQVAKVRDRIEEIEAHPELVNPNAPRRCRSCREPHTICNGLCWGFWKTSSGSGGVPSEKQEANDNSCVNEKESKSESPPPTPDDDMPNDDNDDILPIQAGDKVTPGPHWNDIRYGKALHAKTGHPLVGTVLEVKSWGSGSTECDCVAVQWDDAEALPRRRQVQIYRWGARAVNGSRMYDLQASSSLQEGRSAQPQLCVPAPCNSLPEVPKDVGSLYGRTSLTTA